MKGEVEQIFEDIKIIDDTDITSMLELFREVAQLRSKINQLDEMIKDKVRVYMKERSWNHYSDPSTKISVDFIKIKRKKIDEKQLNFFLNASQLSQVYSVNEYERLDIVTPEARKKMKKFMRGRK